MRLAIRTLLVLVGLLAAAPATALAAPPAGVTGMAGDARVEIGWQPEAGATGYRVFRGTTATTVTTPLMGSPMSPPGPGVTPSFTDLTAANGTTYYYAVRATVGGVESANSAVIQATPRARTCTGPNPVVQENCFPGCSGLGHRPADGHGRLRHRVEHQQGRLRRPQAAGRHRRHRGRRGVPQRLLRRGRGAPVLDLARGAGQHAARLCEHGQPGPARLLELDGQRDADHDRVVALGHVPAARHAPRHGAQHAHPARRARRRARRAGPVRHPRHDLPGVQLLGRQVALRRQVDRRPDRRRDRARRQGLVRPALPGAARRHPARLVHARRLPGRLVAREGGLRRRLHRGLRPRALRRRGARPPRLHLRRPRRVLVGRHAHRARAGARRGRRPLLHRRQRGLLEGSVRAQRRVHRAGPRDGQLQVDPERRRRPERHPDRHLARPRGRQPARERAHGHPVHRPEELRVLPAARARRPGPGPHLALHRPRHAGPGRDGHGRHGARRLGVGRADGQRA